MKYLHPVAAVPNELIHDGQLHYTTKKVALVLLLLAGRKGRSVCVTFAQLARLAHCSPATAQQAVAELISGGYLCKARRYRYGQDQQHLIYSANGYYWLRRQGGYTLIRRELLDYAMPPAAFVNLLYLYCCAGRHGRAFPSLRQIAGLLKQGSKRGLDMAKSTVCRALALLQRLQAVVRLRCYKCNRSFASNSYLPTDMVLSLAVSTGATEGRDSFEDGGSPIFSKPIIINQITGAFTEREKKCGVFQFSNLPNNWDNFASEERMYYDGTGVKVFASGEQELTA